MRGSICALLIVAMSLPSVAACTEQVIVVSEKDSRTCVQGQGAGGGSSVACDGESTGVVMTSDDQGGHWIIRLIVWIYKVVRDGVVFEVVKAVVVRSWERPPNPVQSPNWGETGCGMGAGGASRY